MDSLVCPLCEVVHDAILEGKAPTPTVLATSLMGAVDWVGAPLDTERPLFMRPIKRTREDLLAEEFALTS